MDQNLRRILLETINPNDAVRKNAEEQLKVVECSSELLEIIQRVLMVDRDPLVRQISSIFFANSVKKHWKTPLAKRIIDRLEKEVLLLLINEDNFNRQGYLKILEIILDKSEDETKKRLMGESIELLRSSKDNEVEVALIFYETLFKVESIRYASDTFIDVLFDGNGQKFFEKLNEMLVKKNYKNAKMCMKIIARTYLHYTLPEYLASLTVFQNTFNTALSMTYMEDENEKGELTDFSKMKKWAYFFLFKVANKGLKACFKNVELSNFIKQDEVLEILFTVFQDVLRGYTAGKEMHKRIPIIACDFFTLASTNKHTKGIIKNIAVDLLGSFILPVLRYNEDIEEKFEYDGDNYLWERYNFISYDLNTGTSSLFLDLIQIDSLTRDNMIDTLYRYLETQKGLPEYPSYKYAILGLLASGQRQLLSSMGSNRYNEFLKAYVFPELYSSSLHMVSQALFFISHVEDTGMDISTVLETLKRVTEISHLQHPVLSVEACLAMQYFLINDAIHSTVAPLIPFLLEKVLVFSKYNFLESLNNLMDLIIDQFSSEVGVYAPQFAETLCGNALTHLKSEDESKIASVSGFLTTIEKLVYAAEEKKEIVRKVYSVTLPVIYTIFSEGIEDFLQEGFDLFNTFIFSLQEVDVGMVQIFDKALQLDPSILNLYPLELSDMIDNYLSYGKESVLDPESLRRICGVVDLFINPETNGDDIYDDDYKAGCRVIDSLMLNAGVAAQGAIPNFVRNISSTYGFILKNNTNLDVYALESIMNCFAVAPQSVLSAIGEFIETLMSEVCAKFRRFKRVYDKKVFLLFLGQLFKMCHLLPINYLRLNEAFVETLASLPEAIRSRNRLRDGGGGNEEEYEEEVDSEYDSMDEDVLFETVLDRFDAYEYVRQFLYHPIPNSIGQSAITHLTTIQVEKLKCVLQVPQEQQK